MNDGNREPSQESELLAMERERPAMYMLWRNGSSARPPASLPQKYRLYALPSEELGRARRTVEIDGALTDKQWNSFMNQILPDGLFVVEESSASEWVGTISAIHNPAATRFYFPGGGELGYLVVASQHRNQGLGSALISACLQRFLCGGYRHIFLGVQGWRLPAIRCYLRGGFVPFVHAPELLPRWRAIFRVLGWKMNESAWPRQLPTPSSDRSGR